MLVDLRGKLEVDRFEEVSVPYAGPEPEPPFFPPEAKGRLVWVKHDQFSPHWHFTNRFIADGRTGTPATCKCGDTESSKMDERYQFWWRDWMGKLAPGRSLEENNKEWCDVTHGAKAFTNKHGTQEDENGFRNYIMGWHMDKDEPKQESIVCTGNPLIAVPGKTKNLGGYPCQGVLSLDRSHPLPEINTMMKNPLWVCLVGYATVITRTKVDAAVFPSTVPPTLPINWKGNRRVDPFPNNVEYPTQMTPIPFASWLGEQVQFMDWHCRIKYIRCNRLIALPDNEFPISPFVR